MHFRAFLLGLFLLAPVSGAAQPPAATQQSLMDYKLADWKFPTAVEGLVAQADKAKSSLAKNKAKGMSLLKNCRKDVAAARKKLSRGVHDELFEISGFCAEAMGENKAALKDYDSSLKLRSTNPRARFRKARLLQVSGEHEQAIRQFKEVLWETKISHHEILYSIAKSLLALEKQSEAFKIAEQARLKNPGYLPLLRLLVDLRGELMELSVEPLEKSQMEAQIAADLTLITAQAPLDRTAGLALVRLLLKNSDPLLNSQRLVEAEQIATRFAEGSGFKDEESVRLLFDAQLKRGNTEAAAATLERGQSINPNSEELTRAAAQLKIEQQLKADEEEGTGES